MGTHVVNVAPIMGATLRNHSIFMGATYHCSIFRS